MILPKGKWVIEDKELLSSQSGELGVLRVIADRGHPETEFGESPLQGDYVYENAIG
jgi:hypothetical protein